jgi:hypothetical protein
MHMSRAMVEHIVDEIRQLSDDDRRLLDERLSRANEPELRELRQGARRIADERGIDMDAIDRAVERERYGT